MDASHIILQIASGVALLLWGLNRVSTGLDAAFGSALRRFISTSTSNRFKAIGVGAIVAALLQSSTVTCLIVSAFSANGVITVPGANAVMLGANIGTTIAAQIVSFDVSWITPTLLIAGYVLNRLPRDARYASVGLSLVGLALIFISLDIIKSATQVTDAEPVKRMLAPLGDQPILALAIAALFTWLVHSSLGAVLVVMSFVHSGIIPLHLAFVSVLGANIGGAIPPVIITVRNAPAGRRAALGNLTMRAVGAVAFLPALRNLAPAIAQIEADPARQIVNFHTFFNIALAIAFLPLIGPVTRLTERLLPDKSQNEDAHLPKYLDPKAFDTPVAALVCAAREAMRLSDIIEQMLHATLEAFRTNDSHLVQVIRQKENLVDSLYDAIKSYLARLLSTDLEKPDALRLTQIQTFSTNLEHIGDIIDKSLMELALKKIGHQDTFSAEGFSEIADIHHRVMDDLFLSQNAFMTGDVNMARKLIQQKSTMRDREMEALKNHFQRLSEGVADTIATSSLHLDVLRDLRRIDSYVSLIAYQILDCSCSGGPEYGEHLQPLSRQLHGISEANDTD